METVAVHLPCDINKERLFKRLRLRSNAPYAKKVDRFIEEALVIGVPKIAYKLVHINSRGDDFVVIGGTKFTSRVLRINLEGTYKLVAYVVTCGVELEDWSKSLRDNFDKLLADGVKEEVLRGARDYIFPKIDGELNLGNTADMNPGSLVNWPLTEQKLLFNLIGDVKELIGVELTESCLMSPTKSVSGFHFMTESSYVNCQLCLRKQCPGRKAPFDKKLYENKYNLGKGSEAR